MRRSTIFLLAFGLASAPAFAQSSGTWQNEDPGCDDTIFAGTVESVNRDQRQAQRDADALNDYYKKIKDAPRNASDKLLSCVDVAWPDLPFTGMLPGIEEYISRVGDAAVEQACNQMRDQVRKVDSVFTMPDLQVPSLPDIGDIVNNAASGAVNNAVNNAVGQIPTVPTSPALPGAPAQSDGAFGGLINLIKPPARPANPPRQ